jgi:hypothetical protein
MMAESNGEQALEVPFPLWVLAHPSGKTDKLIRIVGEAGAIGTPFFATKEEADRFLSDNPALPEHYVHGLIKTPEILLMFLGKLERKGFTHAVFNLAPGRGGRFVPIAQLRAAVEAGDADA